MTGREADTLLSPSGFAAALDKRLTALRGLTAVSEILTFYIEYFQAFGAALWVFVDNLGTDGKGRLFLQAESFPELKHPPFYHLDVGSSISGRAVRQNRAELHRRTGAEWDSDLPVSYPEILDQAGINSFVSIPIHLNPRSDLPADAALTFYRQRAAFTAEEFEELRQATLLFAPAYRFVLEGASRALVKDVLTLLRRGAPSDETQADRQALPAEQPGTRMQQVLERIANHFGFVEATIYLHDPSTDPAGRFRLVARVWPWSTGPLDAYAPGDGGLGWVLSSGRPLRLIDLALYDEDRDYYEHHYPGMAWKSRFDIKGEVRRYFELSTDEVWPLSYVCVPIAEGSHVQGALRCCISRKGPYHVDDDALEALTTTAELIADWWTNWIHVRQEREARQSALSIVRSMGSAARYALDHVRDSSGVGKIVSLILGLCRESVPQADIVELWTEESEGTLTLKALAGTAAPTRRIASTEEVKGAGKRNAFRNVLTVPTVLHTELASAFAFAPPDRELHAFTIAPVISKEVRGVLFLGATRAVPWPDPIRGVATSLAEQLALYLDFQHQIGTMEGTQAGLEKLFKQQADLFFDFQHQLRTPILVACRSLQALRRAFRDGEARAEFDDLVSATRRAATVANNLHVFVNLSRGEPIQTSMNRLSAEKTLETIEEASNVAYNQRALHKSVEFSLRKDYPFPLPFFMADAELLELAIDNLLDNAVKYSYPGTTVRVEVLTANYGREVQFSFRSKGIPLSPADFEHLTSRGYRGEMARMTSPEGGGLGLWTISEVMKAMSGRLEIIPTDEKGLLDFRLCFKCYL